MERQQYGLKIDFWNVNGLSEERASDDLLHNEFRKYDTLFLGKVWQYKGNLNNLHHPLGYFHDFVYIKNFNKKGLQSEGILVYYRTDSKKKFQSMISHQKILFGLR